MLEEIENARRRLNVTAAALCRRAGVLPTTYYHARRKAGRKMLDGNIEKLTAALEQIEIERQRAACRVRRIGAEERSAA